MVKNTIKNTGTRLAQRFVFGPAPSRRLGLSLGLDLLAEKDDSAPVKTCTMDCIYCEVGPTRKTSMVRFDRGMAGDLLEELASYLESSSQPLDFITLAGSGEPTLNREIGTIIKGIKDITPVKVAVLTNGSLLFKEEVRRDLGLADLVLPSLDAGLKVSFERICRPDKQLDFDRIIEGLAQFKKEFQGEVDLEILFAKGINDSPEELEALKNAAAKISPDKIHLNTVYRPPVVASTRPLDKAELESIAEFFGPGAEVVAVFEKTGSGSAADDTVEEILNLIGRRPCSQEDLASVLALPIDDMGNILDDLVNSGAITTEVHAENIFFRRI